MAVAPSEKSSRAAPACALPADLNPILGAHVALDGVNAIERIMLACDGTFTFQLEAYVGELIEVDILEYQESALSGAAVAIMESTDGAPVWERKVLLRGKTTGAPYVFAHSYVDAARLPAAMQADLSESAAGIGRLFVDYHLSIYRDLVGYFFEDGRAYAHLFPDRPGLSFLARVYRIFFQGAPVMIITEKMPRDLFSVNKSL